MLAYWTKKRAQGRPGSAAPEPAPRAAADDRGLLTRAPAESFYEAMTAPALRHGHLRDWLLCRRPPEPAPSQFGLVEETEPEKLGVCCSGGGIRSAAFCLGALQELQERDELSRASYLAAVSGGSYIASAISMVAKTSDPGKRGPDSDAGLFDWVKPFGRGSPEEQYLRNRASYLAPTLADKVYLGMRAILGLFINLIFVSLPLAALALVFTGLVLVPLQPDLTGHCQAAMETCHDRWQLPAGFALVPLGALGFALLFGAISILFRWSRDAAQHFFSVWAVRLLLAAVVLGLLLVALPYLVHWIGGNEDQATEPANGEHTGIIGGAAITLIAGIVAQLSHLLSSEPAKKDIGRARKAFGKLGKGARLAVTYAAAAVAGPALLFAIVVFVAAWALTYAHADSHVDMGIVAVGLGVLVLFGLLYSVVDLMTWSLHPFYKRRLSSVFALRRVSVATAKGGEDGSPTWEESRYELRAPAGEDVGIAVERSYDRRVPISETALRNNPEWPTLVVCAAANISDPGATPPGRSVTSFTFSPHAIGGPLVGAVPTEQLERAFDRLGNGGGRRRRDLTLPAAMAMSGAAISPSMGTKTRRPLTFLMALANIRLGVWVPNPRWARKFERDRGLRQRHDRPRPVYLLCELLGLNRIGNKYLYITDGGHYENLGLVELLRRGCTQIYCLDASGIGQDGADFEALGEAIALARSELAVEIEFDAGEEANPTSLRADDKGFAKHDTVTATVRFPPRDDGTPRETGKLVYVRNSMTEQVPWDVRAHHETDARFPNDPTVDQLYTDQKFEAYRELGSLAGAKAAKAMLSAAAPEPAR